MSAATSNRSSAIWSRPASRWSRAASARTSRPRPSSPPRSGCSTRWSAPASSPGTREAFRRKLRAGELDDKEVDVELPQGASGMPMFELPNMPGASVGAINLGDIFGKGFGPRTKAKRMTVALAHEPLVSAEADKMLDQDQVVREAIAARWRATASSSSTRSTRSAPARATAAPTCRARACSATCCR